MEKFGLYIFKLCLDKEIDYNFVEFVLFVVNEKNDIYIVEIVNVLFVCLDLE